MNIVGFMVVGPGEADKYLDLVLTRNKKLCDDIIAVCNNCDYITEDLLIKHKVWIIHDNREWGYYQDRIKQDAYKKIEWLNPDWILPFDADEIFDYNLTREDLEKMASNPLYESYQFYFIQYWNDRQHHNKDLGFWNVRFFKYKRDEYKWENKPLHCGLAPRWAYETAWFAPNVVHHLGLMKEEHRRAKIARYEKFDPNTKYLSKWFYNQLETGKSTELDLNKLLTEVADEVNSYVPRKTKIMANNAKQQFQHLKRLKDGVILDIPVDDVAETLSRVDPTTHLPAFELVSSEVLERGGSAYVPTTKKIVSDEEYNPDAEPEKPYVCDLCGLILDSEEELQKHIENDHHIDEEDPNNGSEEIAEEKEVADEKQIPDEDKAPEESPKDEEEESPAESDEEDSEVFVCDKCGKEYKTKKGLEKHKCKEEKK